MKKTVKISLVTLAVILLIFLMLLITPFVFKDKFASLVKSTANKSLKTELNYSGLDVSFFRHFPHLTITLKDFSLKASAPFNKDTLISAKEISFGVSIISIINGPLRITRVYLDRARVAVQYNEKGDPNFDVYVTADTASQPDMPPTESAEINIENINVRQTDFLYSDASIPLKIHAHGINYKGKSKLSNDILKLLSNIQIDSLDFIYNSVAYLTSKPVKGDLSTSINTKTMEMKFEKNDLKILDILFRFQGQFLLRNDGYDLYLSLQSKYETESLHAMLRLIGTSKLWIVTRVNADINLGKWAKGLGINSVDLKGKLKIDLEADGMYYTGQNPASAKPDTVILSIPDFTLATKLTDGYFKYAALPQALTGISFNINAASIGNDYKKIKFGIENLHVQLLKSHIEGYFRVNGLQDLPVESHIETILDLADLKQAIPLDSLDLAGKLSLKLDLKGNFSPEKELFPVASIDLKLTEGTIQTKYYPRPVEKMNVSAVITNNSGKLSDTRIDLNPLSFHFEGKPFSIFAKLTNPENLSYDITSKGSLDVGKIYQIFSMEGMNLDGHITTDLKLQGRQSDALAGNYGKLNNSGRLELHDIAFTSEYLQKPFVVKTGVFRFDNDKVWFEKFEGHYEVSDITLDGYLSNVINYALSPGQKLKGSFTFRSDYLLADDFMVPEQSAVSSQQSIVSSEQRTANSEQPEPGVIMVPENLEIALKVDAKKIRFKSLDFMNVTAAAEVKRGMLLLKDMNFGLIGCNVSMNATYGTISTSRAFFDFHITANDFDIKRAYNEVELFRNLSTSAGKCEGIISLDYSLKGKIDAGMNPVYPSLEGGGLLTLKKIKVMGMKLFTSMSKNLEKEKIKDPDLSKVELKTTIKNNVITLEKTKMKISGFRFRISGETNFNGAMNFKARLGLPPMGIVGIPMRILGTQDNPKFKYGRGTNDEDVEETSYSDEIPPEMLKKIKEAKEEEIEEEPGK